MTKRSIGVVVLLVVAACGGAAPPPPAASAPASAPMMDERPTPRETDGAPAPTTTAPGVEGGGSRGRASAGPADVDRRRARADFDEAAHQLDTSMSECASACRALASMERATAHLCDIAAHGPSDDDQTTCDDARKKLYAARERVRRACSSCPSGPTLEPGAPP